MKILSVKDYDALSVYGAERLYACIESALKAGRRVNIGLATGNTMIELYKYLAAKLNLLGMSLKDFHTFNLDEYVLDDKTPVPHDHPLSYWKYMHENFFNRLDPKLGFGEENAHFPDPQAPKGFDDDLAAAGGLDLQLLGLGFNGHIAFNEPMSSDEISAEAFGELPTRVIALKELTIQTNARLTAGGDRNKVPHYAATMGMKQILAAKELLLLTCFPEQEAPMKKIFALLSPVPELPGSYLISHLKSEFVYTADCIHLSRTDCINL